MPSRSQVCAWIAGVGLVVPSLAVAQARTEREIVDLIVREGPHVRAIRAEAEVVRREQLARLTYPNPAVTYSREGAGFTEFLQVEQSLAMFGVRGSLARAGVEATAAAEAARDARLWTLRAEAATAVARLVAEQDRLQVAESSAREVERLIEVLRTREREGEGSRFDRLRAEEELRDGRRAQSNAAAAVTEMKALVSAMLPPDVPVDRVVVAQTSSATPLPMEALIARAHSTRAELRALERAASHTDMEAAAVRRSRFPIPSLFGGLKRSDGGSGREEGGVFGLSVPIPLFDAGGREVARWTAERARIEAERTALESQVRAEIRRSVDTLAVRQAAVAEEPDAAGDELMQIAEVAYREGDVGILELLDAVRTSSRAKTRSIDIRLDARLAQIALERAVGDSLWP